MESAVWVLKLYKYFFSPLLHAISPHSGCRFYPSCSEYFVEATQRHGVRGIGYGLIRLFKCHPWGGQGVDLVPESKCGNVIGRNRVG